MRRKLLGIAISMVLGIVFYDSNMTIIPLLFITLFLLIRFKHKSLFIFKKNIEIALLIAILFGIIISFATDVISENNQKFKLDTSGHAICAKIIKIEKYEEQKYKFECELRALDNIHTKTKILVSYYKEIEDPWMLYGKEIKFYSIIEKPKSAGNPGCFDYARYLKSRGISFTTVASVISEEKETASLWDKCKRYIVYKKYKFINSLNCSGQTQNFINGVLFGDTKGMDEDTYKDFRNNGTAHILAVSGLHVGILYGLYNLLNKKRKNKLFTVFFIIILLFYGTLTLWSISVTRAIILIFVMIVGDMFDRRYDLLSALSLASIILLIINPHMVLGVGFQMSFLAVLSIAFFQPFFSKKINGGISTMIAVQLGLMPYMIYVFNTLPLISFICNIPIIFLVSIFVPLGLFTFTNTLLFDLDSNIIEKVFCSLGKMIIELNEMASANGKFTLDIPSPRLWIIVGFYLLSFFIASEFFSVFLKRKDIKKILTVLFFILLIVVCTFNKSYSSFDKASMIFLDVGQGDCVHVRTNGDNDVFIDGGGNINYNLGEKTLKPYLLKNGVWDLDIGAATHLHTDHFLGLQQLSQCFDVKKIITEGKKGDIIKLSEEIFIETIWPLKQNPEVDDENLNSLIFKINCNGITALVTGDITAEGEKAMVEYYKGTNILKADILKVAHHGSKYSTSSEFLKAVSPKVAVISVGKNNYGHPSKDVIEKLKKEGIIIERTDQSGAIGIITERGNLKICRNMK